jgi:L-arabinonolactonase
VNITRIGEFRLGWGESLFWDDRRDRLYFVDCAASTLHWLDWSEESSSSGSSSGGSDGGGRLGGRLETWQLPSMATGLVPTEDGRLVACLEDGLYIVDADRRSCQLMAAYPAALDGRANDACADLSGNLITGKLNMSAAPGSAWRYSAAGEWKLIDPDISNTNGPAVAVLDREMTLIVGDTAADYFSYSYDAESGSVGDRNVFGDLTALDGAADGSSVDADGGLWCALVGGRQLARFTVGGLDRVLALPVVNPTDVTFGGPGLDRLFVVSIGLGAEEDSLDGTLLVVDETGYFGRREPRFAF